MTAPTVTTLDSGNDPAITTSPKTTGSVTVAAGAKCLVAVALINGSTGRTATVTRTTGGASFTKLNEGQWDTLSDSLSWHVLDGPFTDTLVITQNNSIQQMHWAVMEVTDFDTTTPFPQFSGVQIGTGTTFSAPLSSPVNSDSRSIIVTGHHVFQGTSPGSGMTELADSPANSPATSFNVSWSNAAWEGSPSVTGATGAAWGASSLEIAGSSSGTNYNEPISFTITTTTSEVDALAMTDGLAATSNVTSSIVDGLAHAEGLSFTIAATTSIVDGLAHAESLSFTINGTSTIVDALAFVESLAFTINGTSSVLDALALVEGLAFTINGTTSVSDVLNGGGSNYSEPLSFTISGTTSVVDSQGYNEPLAFTIIGTTTVVDARAMVEALNQTANATTTVSDLKAMVETLGSTVAGTTTVTDTGGASEGISFVIVSTTGGIDSLAIHEGLLSTLLATTSVLDVYVDHSVPPFVIVVGTPFQRWTGALKQGWRSASVVDDISEDA
jgi:hypothetical protein